MEINKKGILENIKLSLLTFITMIILCSPYILLLFIINIGVIEYKENEVREKTVTIELATFVEKYPTIEYNKTVFYATLKFNDGNKTFKWVDPQIYGKLEPNKKYLVTYNQNNIIVNIEETGE